MDPLLIDVPERLLTPRLVLRAPRAGDGEAVHAAIAESIDTLRPWLAWAQQLQTPAEVEASARRAAANFALRTDLVYSFWRHDGDGLEAGFVGGSGLHRIDWAVPRFEIGYWCRSACVGRGYASEVVRALAAMAFDSLQAERVEVRMDEDNVASRRVAERAGFTLEGILRNDSRTPAGAVRSTCVYARLRADAAA